MEEEAKDAVLPTEQGRAVSSAELRVISARYRRCFVAFRMRGFERKRRLGKLEELPGGEARQCYREIWPVRKNGEVPPWGIGLGWAPWGAMDWRYYRAWALSRISCAIPLTVWDAGGLPTHLPSCPYCKASQVRLDHVVASCPGTANVREEEWPGSGRPANLQEWLEGQ